MGVVTCDFTSSLMTQDGFLTKDFRLDPFENSYLQTVLRMDKKALMEIPILDDDTFLSRLNQSDGSRTKGEFYSNQIRLWIFIRESNLLQFD
jgi:hypothetical protein